MNWFDKLHKDTFSTQKTARIFTYGNLSSATQHVWLLFHGYGQLATGVMKQFANLDENEHYVIAPEGLSRFYVKGVYGKVGASWMTKEDRELEIQDQFTYLDQVQARYLGHIDRATTKIHLLGFSQGVATLTRWLAREPFVPDSIIYYAGSVPTEDIPKDCQTFTQPSIYYLAGTEDEYISEENYQQMVKMIEDRVGKPITAMQFKGHHKITAEGLQLLMEAIRKDA